MADPHRPSKAIPEQPITFTFQLQWSATPAWLPTVTVNQHVNHITTPTDRAEEWQLTDGQTRRLK
jgi:hypothetical protein